VPSKLQQLKRQHKHATVAMIAVAAIIIFLLMYYAGNGFSLNDTIIGASDTCSVRIIEPTQGQSYQRTDDIRFTGTVLGGIPEKVFIWNDQHNVPIHATISGTSWGVSMIAGDLAHGEKIINVQAQLQDGRWTPVESVSIEVDNYIPPESYSPFSWFPSHTTWSEQNLPAPLATVFRPVEEVLAQTVVYVTGGTAHDDLDGNNIPDQLEQSPFAPRYNPYGAPMTIFFVYGIIAFIIFSLIYFVIRPYLKRKQEAQKQLESDAGWRYWKMQMQALTDSKMKAELQEEKAKRKALEKQIKESIKKQDEATKRRPVIVNIQDKKGGKTPAKKQPISLSQKLKDKTVTGIRRIPNSEYYQKIRGKVKH